METVGIRDFRNNLSRWLRAVKSGESVLITERGRPVARLTPANHSPVIERMIAEGKITPAKRPKHKASAKDLIKARGTVSDLVRDQRR
jgi:prevent-host-death family protein